MTVELHDGTNHDGLFDLLGKAFAAQIVLNTARGTDVPDAVLDVLSIFKNLASPTVDQQQSTIGIAPAIPAFQNAGSGLASALQSYAQQYLIATVNADTPLAQKTLQAALTEIIRQMKANTQSVDASTVGITVTAGTNSGDGVILTSKKRGDGLVQEHSVAETLAAVVNNDGTPATAGIAVSGAVAAQNLLGQDWPLGSGASGALTATDAAANLLTNSDFEDETTIADAPDGWIIPIGTIGTTLKMTDVEIQTVVISGTPGSGTYLLNFTNKAGKVQTTVPLAYNATSAEVQAALRALDGLASVTVVQSGTSPNLTHTITFVGYGGDITQLTSTSRLDTGSIAHNTTSAGTPQVYGGGKALWLASNGSELTTLYQRLTTLQTQTAYAVSLWATADALIAAGVITIDLVDGIGGTVIADAQGVNNSLTFNATSLTTSWKHLKDLVSGECVFRTPAVLPPLVYLRLRISTAVTNGRSIFLDHMAMAEMRSLYTGGPLAAAFSGAAPLKNGDSWSIAVTNDRAGLLHEMLHRNFNLSALGLLIPSNNAGAETVPDSCVS